MTRFLKRYEFEILIQNSTKSEIIRKKLLAWFPDNKYVDVEGLCKIADLDEIKENDYSPTLWLYVGNSIQIDEDFDYKARMTEINS